MAKPQWSPEHAVEAELARTLIASQFPKLTPVEVLPFGHGWDNSAYLVNEEFVFRFPRRKLGVDCLQAEIAVLPNIASRLSLPISNPLYVGAATEGFPYPFAGYRRIDGHTACTRNLSAEQRIALAEPIGRFLRELHSISAEEAIELGAGPDRLRRLDFEYRKGKVLEQLETIEEEGLLDTGALRELLEDLVREVGPSFAEFPTDHPESQRRSMLVHGDLYARHLVVDETNMLRGVIDWGDVHWGSPAVDLGMVHAFVPLEGHRVFRETYGDVEEAVWRAAEFRALYHSATIALYGREIGDGDLEREGLEGLGFIGTPGSEESGRRRRSPRQ